MNPRRHRLALALPCAVAAASIFYFGLAEKTKPAQTRTLSFAEHVAYQRAIEEVYWRHRIWPNEHAAKPSLDQVMSQAQIEKKVADYLRNSQALEDYWQRPITAEQLQTEMNRIAQHTKQPEVLRELFAALGNDPFIIAECLARPALAERVMTHWYAYDERFHGELKRRAQAELQACSTIEQLKQLASGSYSEIEFARSDKGEDDPTVAGAVKLRSREWDEHLRRLAATFRRANKTPADIETGRWSALQEDQSSYYATAVIEKTTDRLKLATVAWAKEPFESWRNRAQDQMPASIPIPTARYTFPSVSDVASSCTDDTWTATLSPSDARARHTAVWTGSEMIIWGGFGNAVNYLSTGGRYNPATDTWTATSTTNAPSARYLHTAVWTGSEMIVWGGANNSGLLNTGARYNPDTDVWISTSTVNAPSARTYQTAIWSGKEMIVWGGTDTNNSNGVNTGGKYNPSTDVWTSTSTVDAPEGRRFHTAVRSGALMVVWGGSTNSSPRTNTGGNYNPPTDSWEATSTINAPVGRDFHSAVWTGTEMIVWGGLDISNNELNSGGKYNALTNTWIPTSMTNVPAGRSFHTAVWTRSEMIVWGGFNGLGYLNSGGRYSPVTDSWAATSTTDAPSGREAHTAVWSDSEMIVWGGADDANVKDDGERYDPLTDSWTPVGTMPIPKHGHSAVWTGTEMITWGGFQQEGSVFSNTGAKYSPATDDWTATTVMNAPSGREFHSAFWSGTEMIVWGGNITASTFTNTGGRYNPDLDSWTATTTTNVPTARELYTAVWTGSEMIVWGGYDGTSLLNTGARYDPTADSWTATSTTNAAPARDDHTAVWTGSQMIVWGGFNGRTFVNTGGKYSVDTDSWAPTSTANAPRPRQQHTAVWTGTEMIAWGGYNTTSLNTGGRYNPDTNSWATVSTVNAPTARVSHTALWTGGEMIIWGGYDGVSNNFMNTGGRYSPTSDSWTVTSLINAPAGRIDHTGIWTGTEMIIWGGLVSGYIDTATGGKYCASSTPTPTPSPSATPTPTPAPSPTPTATPIPTPIRVRVAVSPTSINEGQSATYTVTASSTVSQSIIVGYVMSGTATNGTDYRLSGTPNQVTIPAGQSSAIVTSNSKADHVTEGTETAIMTLQPGSGYGLGNPKQATVSILDSP